MEREPNIAPFYAGQRVVGSGAHPGSRILKDHPYVISGCEYKPSTNPIAHGKCFWYIGIVGFNDGAVWFSPTLVVPIQENFQSISLEKILEEETKLISVN